MRTQYIFIMLFFTNSITTFVYRKLPIFSNVESGENFLMWNIIAAVSAFFGLMLTRKVKKQLILKKRVGELSSPRILFTIGFFIFWYIMYQLILQLILEADINLHGAEPLSFIFGFGISFLAIIYIAFSSKQKI